MCSKCFHFLSLVSRLLCLFCLNGPFFVLLTCEIGVYLQVYIHILILNVHRPCEHTAPKWGQHGEHLGRIVAV